MPAVVVAFVAALFPRVLPMIALLAPVALTVVVGKIAPSVRRRTDIALRHA